MKFNPEDIKDLRYERKFVTETDDIDSLVYLIKLNNGMFSEVFYERRVNSIYFDTHFLKFYSDNVVGNPDRSKVRIRWYGDNIKIMEDSTLEIKSKNGHVGKKDHLKIGDFRTFDFIQNHKDYVNQRITEPSYAALLDNLVPSILVSYSRRYFLSADKKFRITLDYDIEFYDLRTGFKPLKKTKADISIIEVKYKSEDDFNANLITQNLPHRYSKSSKYLIGLELIN